ncbi:sigma-G-dependent sporulation-specific acid-soluble spore protein CsgA [Neobacillus sp. LXY-4]|uniref:sigma-G-dependent sporulation-specific acid-soluble spore protein CsgA n=1 Tax=Neobacillus sp. LXY-4 TaxID=3379826 RepID=UPI003EE1A792
MDKTLGYLREILSNYTDQYDIGKRIYKKLVGHNFHGEGAFVKALDQEEIDFLDRILPDEINYAKEEQDSERARQLNEVYELLF